MPRIRDEVEAGSEAIQASAASVQNASDWAANLIAALMSERGIDVREVHSSAEEEFVNCVTLELVTDKENLEVRGTLSSNKKPRIVKINNVYVEAVPSGNILFIRNNDIPGIVGAVGTALGDAKINIAYITFGREKEGATAVSVVNVDSDIPVNVIEGLKKIKGIQFVKMLKV